MSSNDGSTLPEYIGAFILGLLTYALSCLFPDMTNDGLRLAIAGAVAIVGWVVWHYVIGQRFKRFKHRNVMRVLAQSAVSDTADLEKWLDRCHNLVVDTSGERHAHIYARQSMLTSEVPQEWWDSHYALDERARIIELELQDHILPRAEALDPQLADILRCLREAFGKLRLAIRNVWSDRPESEHGMAKARLNALLGVGDGYVDLPCPLCDGRFESKQELKDHFDSNHPAPSPDDQMLISVGIHDINVGKAVEPLRELIRQANHRIAPAFNPETKESSP